MVNGCLYSPQPLCIKMGVGNHVGLIRLLRINMGTYAQRKQQEKNQFFHHIKLIVHDSLTLINETSHKPSVNRTYGRVTN